MGGARSAVIEQQLFSRPEHLFCGAQGFPCTPGQRLPEQSFVPQERPREVLSIRDYANRLRYIYTLMIDRDSLNEATRVSVFMNGLVESPSRSDLFRRIPKTFEEAVKIALKEEFSQASAQGMSAGSDQWDMDVSSMEQFPQREA
ncbi:unnamed protein product, partial [Aphanomyces euteiches]